MTLRTLLAVSQIAGACAYALLAFRLLRTGRLLALPWFTAYCCLMVVDLAWSPTDATRLSVVAMEMALLSLRFCVVVEAVCIVSEGTNFFYRRYLVFAFLLAGVAAGVRVMDLYPIDDIVGIYRTMRQVVHTALAVIATGFAVYQATARDIQWKKRWTPHLLLVSAYMTMRAGRGFVVPTVGKSAAYHHSVRIYLLLLFCAWITVWLWYDRRELRAARLP